MKYDLASLCMYMRGRVVVILLSVATTWSVERPLYSVTVVLASWGSVWICRATVLWSAHTHTGHYHC